MKLPPHLKYGTRATRPLEERFFSFVEKTETCWIWRGQRHRTGYGLFYAGKNAKAHRVSYEMFNCCRVPSHLMVMHSCDNRPCVNPAHLSVGTQKDNMQDAAKKGRISVIGQSRKTHCLRGHPLSGANVHLTPQGHRRCVECSRAANRVQNMERRGKPRIAAAIRQEPT